MKHLQEIQHLDFVPELKCNRRTTSSSPRCGKPVTWIVKCNGCGVGAVVCGQCRLFLEVRPVMGPHECGLVGDPQKVLTFERLVAE